MIILREREMKRDVSNNKRITSFRVKIQEPSSGKKRNRSKSVIKSHLQLIDERGDGDDIVWTTTTTTTAIHFQSSRRRDGGRDFAHRRWSRGVRHLCNLCFVLFFLSRVFRVVFCGAASWENRVKKRAHLLKQTPQNKAETTIKYEEKRERERVEE